MYVCSLVWVCSKRIAPSMCWSGFLSSETFWTIKFCTANSTTNRLRVRIRVRVRVRVEVSDEIGGLNANNGAPDSVTWNYFNVWIIIRHPIQVHVIVQPIGKGGLCEATVQLCMAWLIDFAFIMDRIDLLWLGSRSLAVSSAISQNNMDARPRSSHR